MLSDTIFENFARRLFASEVIILRNCMFSNSDSRQISSQSFMYAKLSDMLSNSDNSFITFCSCSGACEVVILEAEFEIEDGIDGIISTILFRVSIGIVIIVSQKLSLLFVKSFA